ncbi:MAG: hypothetical protein D6681_17270 [Calditrichaeota bacterium]|nr:MAG: hypothetical protein D6681_17270 [Calditrichota bacterium]
MLSRDYLAVDLHHDRLQYVHFQKFRAALRAVDFGEMALPREWIGDPAALTEALRGLPEVARKASTILTVGYFSPAMHLREVVLPEIKRPADLVRAIGFQNTHDLPPIDGPVDCCYQIVETFTDGSLKKQRLLVLVVPRSVTETCLTAFLDAGAVPTRLIPRPFLFQEAYRRFVSVPGNDLLVEVSEHCSTIAYFHHGQLRYLRTVPVGFVHMDQSELHARSLTIDPDELAQQAEENVYPETMAESDALRRRLQQKLAELQSHRNPALQRLYGEIWRTLKNLPDASFERILLAGYGGQVPPLAPFLGTMFHRPVSILAPQFDEPGEASLYAQGQYLLSIGAVLTDSKTVDLLPSQYRQQRTYRKLNKWLLIWMGLTLAGIGAISFLGNPSLQMRQELLTEYQQRVEQLEAIETDYHRLLKELEATRKQKEELLSAIPRDDTILQMLRLFSRETPGDIRLRRLEIFPVEAETREKANGSQKPAADHYEIRVEGQIIDNYFLADLVLLNYINHLNSLQVFRSIELQQVHKEPEEKRFEFQISARL